MSDNWIEAASVDDVPEGDVICADVGDSEIALCKIEGEIYAVDNICTHGLARLCEGFIDGHEIECPLHQGKFDVRSGKAMCDPVTEDVRTYPVKIADGKVFVSTE